MGKTETAYSCLLYALFAAVRKAISSYLAYLLLYICKITDDGDDNLQTGLLL